MFENVFVQTQVRGAATPYQWGRPRSLKFREVYTSRVPGLEQHKHFLMVLPLAARHWAAVALV